MSGNNKKGTLPWFFKDINSTHLNFEGDFDREQQEDVIVDKSLGEMYKIRQVEEFGITLVAEEDKKCSNEISDAISLQTIELKQLEERNKNLPD